MHYTNLNSIKALLFRVAGWSSSSEVAVTSTNEQSAEVPTKNKTSSRYTVFSTATKPAALPIKRNSSFLTGAEIMKKQGKFDASILNIKETIKNIKASSKYTEIKGDYENLVRARVQLGKRMGINDPLYPRHLRIIRYQAEALLLKTELVKIYDTESNLTKKNYILEQIENVSKFLKDVSDLKETPPANDLELMTQLRSLETTARPLFKEQKSQVRFGPTHAIF